MPADCRRGALLPAHDHSLMAGKSQLADAASAGHRPGEEARGGETADFPAAPSPAVPTPSASTGGAAGPWPGTYTRETDFI